MVGQCYIISQQPENLMTNPCNKFVCKPEEYFFFYHYKALQEKLEQRIESKWILGRVRQEKREGGEERQCPRWKEDFKIKIFFVIDLREM